jgi:hypothetical protein
MNKKTDEASKTKVDEEKCLEQFIKVMVRLGLKYGDELLAGNYSMNSTDMRR